MASTFTTNKSIEKPANGDYVNTWSTPVNSDFDIIDVSLGGTTTLNATGASGTTTLSASQYRPPTIIVTGVLTANVTYRVPSGVGGQWVVYNNTSGAFTVTFDSGGGGTSTVIPQGARILIYCDGTNVALGVTITPSIAAGSSGEIQYNSGGALAASSNLTFDGSGNVVLGATLLGRLDVRNTIRLYGATSGYFGLTVPAAAGATTYTLPNVDGTSGQVLTTNGSGTLTWTTVSPGVSGVTSFSAGSTGLTPVGATTGAVSLGGTLNVANGGTGSASASGARTNLGLAIGTDIPSLTGTGASGTWSISITGNAANVSGTVAVANGGTGANTLTGYVKGNGTSAFTASATVPGSDVSGNISGNAANVTGTVAVANGGTGQTTYTNGQLLIGNTTGNTLTKSTLTAGTGVSITNGTGTITIASTVIGLPTMNVVSGTSQTAVAGNQYVLTNASATTVTLPTSPSAGDTVYVTVANNRTDNVIARNGQNIQSLAENMILNFPYAAAQLRYADATRGWVLV